MRVLRFMFSLLKPYWGYIFTLAGAVTYIALDAVVRPLVVKQMIDGVANGASHYDLIQLCVILGAMQFIYASSWSVCDYCMTKYGYAFRCDIVARLMDNLSDKSYAFFQNNQAGNLTTKVNDAFKMLPNILDMVLFQFGRTALMIVGALITLSWVHPLLSVGMAGWAFVFLTWTIVSLKKGVPLVKNYAEEKAKVMGQVADYTGNALAIKTFAAHDYEQAGLNQARNAFIPAALRQGFFFMRFYFTQGMVTLAYMVGFISFLVYGYGQGWVTPGDFAFVIMANHAIISQLFELSHVIGDFVRDWGAVDQSLALLTRPTEVQDAPDATTLTVTRGEIEFKRVDFHYPNSDNLFEELSVCIHPGEKVGLVGYSGGGKTSFVNLLLRLFDVQGGMISIDGQDITMVTQDSLRAHITFVPQDPALFHRTVWENIHFANPEATEEEVIAAAKKAHAHEFITYLPKGYHTLVGERGVKLSGGQKQRIAIARAFLKRAPILVFDEATSQLDSLTEKAIQSSLTPLLHGKTALMIAHRLSTLMQMDRILVFEQGQIVEDGSHDALLRLCGRYHTLWQSQVDGMIPLTATAI